MRKPPRHGFCRGTAQSFRRRIARDAPAVRNRFDGNYVPEYFPDASELRATTDVNKNVASDILPEMF